jgi:hypothetical protein
MRAVRRRHGDRSHRPEHLFPSGGDVIGAEDHVRRQNLSCRTTGFAADRNFSALGFRAVDCVDDRFPLIGVDDGSDLGGGVGRIAGA